MSVAGTGYHTFAALNTFMGNDLRMSLGISDRFYKAVADAFITVTAILLIKPENGSHVLSSAFFCLSINFLIGQ